jgi:hypothetical protein
MRDQDEDMYDRDDSCDDRRDTDYIWNRVTKERILVYSDEALEEIKKQKYPQNWIVIDVCTCSNCGGSWDGNRDCQNYCLQTIRHREDPNPEPTDLGEVTSWEEVFEKARMLHFDEQLDMLATISITELASDKWHAPMIHGWKMGKQAIPADEVLRNMAVECPAAYPGNDRFHMFTKDMLIAGFDGHLHRAYTQLVVTYLKPGESFTMPAAITPSVAV